MKLTQQVSLQQTQKLIITPELRQGIEILQYTSVQLMNHIQTEMLDNPLVDVDNNFDKMAKLILDNYANYSSARVMSKDNFWADTPDELTAADAYTEKKETLIEHLRFQLRLLALPEIIYRVASYIIETVSPAGYVDFDVEEVAQVYGVTESEVIEALSIVQQFDPVGVCARNLSECLVLQLREQAGHELALKIVANDIEVLAAGHKSVLAQKYQCSLSDIQKAVDRIKCLNPKPGLRYAGNELLNYVWADVEVKLDRSGYIILVNESTAPRLHINAYYKRAIEQKQLGVEARHYLNQKMARVLKLIKSIEQRRITLYNVTASIIKFQPQFFSGYSHHLNPLRLKDIAEDITAHESTVSRAISGKYVQTPAGVFPFNYFLQSGIVQAQGQMISAENIKNIIRKLIEQENHQKPLSDQKIANLIKAQGVDVSRRTIAKYREAIGITSSSKRKRH